jgi:hypothetical protein
LSLVFISTASFRNESSMNIGFVVVGGGGGGGGSGVYA